MHSLLGGQPRSQLTHEVEALGGEIGKVADRYTDTRNTGLLTPSVGEVLLGHSAPGVDVHTGCAANIMV